MRPMQRPFHPPLHIIILPWLLFAAHTTAQPQSPATLRQQIDRLQQQIDTLHARIDALQRENDKLTAENESLRRALDERGHPQTDATGNQNTRRTPPHAETTTTPIPPETAASIHKPSASPDALFIALVIDYAENFHDSPLNDESTETARRRAVRQWTTDVRTRLAGRDEWLARITNIGPRDEHKNRRAQVSILDPISLKPIARTFNLTFPPMFAERLTAPRTPAQDTLWKIRIEIQPDPVYQPQRLAPGPFDYPRFIGPFAGFGFSVDIQSLAPISLEDATKAAAQRQRALTPVDR